MGPEKVKASLIYIKQKLKTYSPNNSASYEEHPEPQVQKIQYATDNANKGQNRKLKCEIRR